MNISVPSPKTRLLRKGLLGYGNHEKEGSHSTCLRPLIGHFQPAMRFTKRLIRRVWPSERQLCSARVRCRVVGSFHCEREVSRRSKPPSLKPFPEMRNTLHCSPSLCLALCLFQCASAKAACVDCCCALHLQVRKHQLRPISCIPYSTQTLPA